MGFADKTADNKPVRLVMTWAWPCLMYIQPCIYCVYMPDCTDVNMYIFVMFGNDGWQCIYMYSENATEFRQPCYNKFTEQNSLVPRPHPLMRRNGLVNQIEFLRPLLVELH